MLTTYGTMPKVMPAGYFKAVEFPVLALLNKTTADGRKLMYPGGGARDLPLTIRAAFSTEGGHYGAENTGALFEVSFDPDFSEDYGVVSGKGFLANDEFGRRHARAIKMQMMRGNSVDLTEAAARYVEEADSGEYWIEFYEWKLAMTTGVGTPAFAEAYAVLLDEMSEEDMVASVVGADPMDPLVVSFADFGGLRINLPAGAAPTEIELTAGTITQPFDAFFQPEPVKPQKLTQTSDGWVSGHLGLWNTPHDGIQGQPTYIPRPPDGYASFNKPGVPTEQGIIGTGPLFLYGGHKYGRDLSQAYGGVENTWANVRITEGKLGPWLSGMVRPAATDAMVFDGLASRISGHWVGDKLKAIVSVNGEGFDVPGDMDEFERDLAAGLAVRIDAEGELTLIASFEFDGEQGSSEATHAPVDTAGIILALLLEEEDAAS